MSGRRKFAFRLLFGILAASAWGQTPAPEFTAASILAGDTPMETVVPGGGGTIYGHFLGPAEPHGCAGTPDYRHPQTPSPRNPDPRFIVTTNYPKELCGVQVWIGDKPAGLLYVTDKQINFQIPQDSAETGTVELRVVYQGRSSSVTLPAGFEKTTVWLDQPAYTGMPVWLRVKMPRDSGVANYPSVLGPAAFGCNDVEVRRDGQLLPRLAGSVWNDIGVAPGNICWAATPPAALQGRLPLHLLYSFDVPGTYEVRFTRSDRPSGVGGDRQIRARSEWTPIVVLQSAPDQRAKWLEDLRRKSPADAAELVADVSPSLLGHPDDASLAILIGYLDHPDVSVRAYAIRGFHYWPDDLVARKLLEFLHAKGPAGELAEGKNEQLRQLLRRYAIPGAP